jgi:hypothetical protein
MTGSILEDDRPDVEEARRLFRGYFRITEVIRGGSFPNLIPHPHEDEWDNQKEEGPDLDALGRKAKQRYQQGEVKRIA